MRSLSLLAAVALAGATGAIAAPPDPPPRASVSFEGPALSFDFPAVRIGVAEYEDGPTGATVLYFPKPVMAAVDVRGGAPGTVETDVLRLAYETPFVNAITLAGGSSYGLSVATGVAGAVKESTADPGNWQHIAVVPGAIIFDLGGRRYNAVTPDGALGRAALNAARSGWFPLGSRGAGRFAMQGWYLGDPQHSGQGAAFRQAGAIKVLVVTVVNALGAVVDRGGHVVRCTRPAGSDCGLIAERLAARLGGLGVVRLGDARAEPPAHTANTTISVLVTNQALPFWALQRLAVQVHNSMARAIQPFGSADDGDTLFAVTTGEIKEGLAQTDLGTLASEAAWDAVLASVPALPAAPPRAEYLPPAAALEAATGRYAFAPDVVAQLRRRDTSLEIDVSGRDSLYLPAGRPVALVPAAADEFTIEGTRADRLRIDRDARGRIVGLTINPGPWPIRAQRLPGG